MWENISSYAFNISNDPDVYVKAAKRNRDRQNYNSESFSCGLCWGFLALWEYSHSDLIIYQASW